MGEGPFGIHYVANGGKHARLGMAVSIRVAGSAVRRNGIRRVIRESFRLHQHELPALDVFVTARQERKKETKSKLAICSLQSRLTRQQ